jgi:thymidylate synthase (FAD)
MTANLRAWRHFIEMRASLAAEPLIRELALMIYRKLLEKAPSVFGDYQIVDGELVTHTRKV